MGYYRIKVRLLSRPRRYPDYAVVMALRGYAPEMMELDPGGHTHFARLLYHSALAVFGWRASWDRLSAGVWDLHADHQELFGVPPDSFACADAIRKAFAAAGVDAEVEVVTPTTV
jgi:hypothetical protein